MPAFVISDVRFLDQEAVEAYRRRAAVSIAHYGGRYLVRGGAIERLEGPWDPKIIIIVEFPDMDRARSWYRSPECAAALEFRDRAISRSLILVEGIAQTA